MIRAMTMNNTFHRSQYFSAAEEEICSRRFRKAFRQCKNTLKLLDNIVTEAGLPRFAAPRDEFVIPVTVFNTSFTNKVVTVNLKPEGLYLNYYACSLQVPAGEQKRLYIHARALGGANRAALKITTSWDDKQLSSRIEIPVRSACPAITLGGSGVFQHGQTKIDMPSTEGFTGELTGTFTLAGTPAVEANKAVTFLNNYPYGCLEQTISTAWPLLILPDAVAELDPLITNDTQLKERIDGATGRIQSMQLYDGSFASWPGTTTPYNFGSVYAAHFLLKAKDAGVNFPEEMLTGVMNWLRQYLASMPAYTYEGEELDDFTTKAYAVYVLALTGERPLGWIEYLREHEASLRQSGRIWLAGAQAMIDGNADPLRTLELGRMTGYSGPTLESETRNIAVLLTMWLDLEPQAPEVTELALRLVKLGEKGVWYSTQDNSAALTALARYNVEAAGAKSDIHARLTTETSDKALLTFTGETASINVSELPKDGQLLIEADGTGQGCYSWSITGTPTRQPKAERRNVNVECVYFDEQGRGVDLSRGVSHGAVIQCVLTVKPSMTVNNLVLNYLLPAGFEIENPRLDDSGEAQSGSYGIVNDIRDDRLTLFFDRLSGERSYGFKMRAVTRGKFRVPQVSAYGMYDAGIRFTGSVQPDVEIK